MKRVLRFVVQCLPLRLRLWLRKTIGLSPLGVFYTRYIVGLDKAYGIEFINDNASAKASKDIEAIAKSIFELFAPRSVIDIGCGAATFIKWMRQHGCQVCGCDISPVSEKICDAAGIDFLSVDMSKAGFLSQADRTFDLVSCMEVAEHIPESRSNELVSFLSALCKSDGVICFAAAPVGQGGVMHINEQPPKYWIERFASAGWLLDNKTGSDLRDEWNGMGIINPRVRNFLVFRKRV